MLSLSPPSGTANNTLINAARLIPSTLATVSTHPAGAYPGTHSPWIGSAENETLNNGMTLGRANPP